MKNLYSSDNFLNDNLRWCEPLNTIWQCSYFSHLVKQIKIIGTITIAIVHVIYFIKISFFSFSVLYIYRYESKRQEIEAWLMRMESRAERMGNAAAQADVLDFSALEASQKEQKVCGNNDDFHSFIYFFCSHDITFCGRFKFSNFSFTSFYAVSRWFRSCHEIWNINDFAASSCTFFFFVLSKIIFFFSFLFHSIREKLDVPCWITHLQASHWTFQSINSKAYCRLSSWWHITNQANDREC